MIAGSTGPDGRPWHDVPVSREWFVRIHNDEITSALVVIDALHRLCGLPWPNAIDLTRRVHWGRSADVPAPGSQAEAENLAVSLQRCGLRTTVWCR
ncbi:ATP-dependent Clp protease adaptor ClpS [Saccharomonospora azurea]|uniref:ATP-dependent Clp protease adaptor protein ClpS n=1 Tax=Saccharomonospora azurea NA-128 TaxID=882081 RepID=H8GBH5_9PSEU|nr:ATP-dependent Clp protease adaptor ClpS [Saccharomonospora azurea]EHY87697.1 ATP-dependent Clp protease adaptor protein ClpS [Saccharomonospora azurea NA-128]